MVSGQSFLYITAAFPCEERAARKVSLIDQEHREIIQRDPHSCLVADLAPDGERFLLKVIRMARSGSLPAHPRRQWRFKLPELDNHMQSGLNAAHPPVRHAKGE